MELEGVIRTGDKSASGSSGSCEVDMADTTGGQEPGTVVSRPNAGRRDPYEVLGLPRDATDQQIKSTYRKLALK